MSRQSPYATPLDYSTSQGGGRLKTGVLGWLVFAGLAVLVFLLVNRDSRSHNVTIPLSEFDKQLRADNVQQVTIGNDELTGSFRTPVVLPISRSSSATAPMRDFRTPLPAGTSGNWAFTEWVLNNRGGAAVYVDNQQNLLVNLLVPLIPWVVIFVFIWFFVFRQMRKGNVQLIGTANQPVGQPAPPANQ